ncbi:MAG: glycine zipper domain-containing protein [Thermoguttaceae bacterium]|jgi:hypothetical protein
MRHALRPIALFALAGVLSASGCATHTQTGAAVGGLAGAGAGAVVGHAMGNTAAGAAIGAGVGALTGAAIGNSQDQAEARNRAIIEQQIGRQLAGAVRVDDVIAMTRAGVAPELIMNHVRAHGMAAPLQANDLIVLQQQGVDSRVIATMQTTPVAGQPVIVEQPPPPVIVEGYYDRPYYYHPHHYYYW